MAYEILTTICIYMVFSLYIISKYVYLCVRVYVCECMQLTLNNAGLRVVTAIHSWKSPCEISQPSAYRDSQLQIENKVDP